MRRPGYPRGLGWGQVPALHVSLWTLDMSRPSRIGVRDMLSYQSLMPAGAGTPRYEIWVHWLREGFRCGLWPRTPHPAGEKPQRYIPSSTLGSRCSGDGRWCRRPVPDATPGACRELEPGGNYRAILSTRAPLPPLRFAPSRPGM